MSWRDSLLTNLGPGLLGGVTLGDWLRLLSENNFDVALSRLPRALAITLQSGQNSMFRMLERIRTGRGLEGMAVPPPLFLLGHWRNGTTHLHNLMAVDDRFAFPNTYQACFPHTFLTTERLNSWMLGSLMPKRRPMDNVEWTMESPQEDEFALCNSSLMSPCLGWVFPARRAHYDRYLTFRDVTEVEIERWREALLDFVRKLTWKYSRPLVLKSPPHTSRIRLLLELFPQARFVHIHRNPYEVFPSSRKTFLVSNQQNGLRLCSLDGLDDWILRQYRLMYDAFFDERGLIPSGHFHELGFEQLEADPIGEIRRLYEALAFPDFHRTEAALRKYVDSIAGYQKNVFPALAADLRRRIAAEWGPCFRRVGLLRVIEAEIVVAVAGDLVGLQSAVLRSTRSV